MKPRQKTLFKTAVVLAVSGLVIQLAATLVAGRTDRLSEFIFVACEFIALNAILVAVLTFGPMSLIKVALGLAVEGVLAFLAVLLAGGGDPHGWSGPLAWGVFALFEIAALTIVIVLLAAVSRNPDKSASRNAVIAARVTIQLILAGVGLILGSIGCALLLGDVFKLGLGGLFIGMFAGMPIGGVLGGLLGRWIATPSGSE